MKLPMPIGIDDFKEVRESYYFVDKTFFLKRLIDAHSKVTLYTRPRRFGKTLIMSMVKYFFDREHAEANGKLFSALAIEHAGESYLREQGKYPVVFLTLKSVKDATWEECYNLLRDVIQREFLRHKYLLDSDRIAAEDKAVIDRILNLKAEMYEYRLSLKNLTLYLHQHYGTRPILLIDEYDTPMQSGFEHGYYDKISGFMKVWLNEGLKGNTSLEFALLTGVLRVAKESIFSDLNNLEVNSVVRGDAQDVFGFTFKEVEQIAAAYGAAEKIAEVKDWYDGYQFGEVEIYNPWSVLNYFRYNCKPAPYWLNTSGNGIIRGLLHAATLEMREDLAGLMEGKPVETSIYEGLVYDEIYKRKDALYIMLLTTGYLTICEVESLGGDEIYSLCIPNQEIRQVYRAKVMEYLAEEMAIEGGVLMLRDLLKGNAPGFRRRLGDILCKMASYYDTKREDKEGFYHGLMLGLVAILSSGYEIRSNRESGYGRFDLAIFPKDRMKAGVIMEFKTAAAEEQLKEEAQRARAQIDTKAYEMEFTAMGIRTVYKYGIAFCGKKVYLADSI